jgi:hypothetical protein
MLSARVLQFHRTSIRTARLPRDKPRPHKLHPIYLGPYSVILQTKNDVEVRHLASGKISTYYVEDLKMFVGNADNAYKLAILDFDQYQVNKLTAHRGDSLLCSTMYFLVHYEYGDTLWMPWSRDLSSTEAYHDYALSKPALYPLILDSTSASKWLRDTRKLAITRATDID